MQNVTNCTLPEIYVYYIRFNVRNSHVLAASEFSVSCTVKEHKIIKLFFKKNHLPAIKRKKTFRCSIFLALIMNILSGTV